MVLPALRPPPTALPPPAAPLLGAVAPTPPPGLPAPPIASGPLGGVPTPPPPIPFPMANPLPTVGPPGNGVPMPPPPAPDPQQLMLDQGIDPLENPLMAMLLMAAPFMEKNKPRPGPIYPTWYRPPPKPSDAQVQFLARYDQDYYRPRNKRFEEDYARIHLKTSGVFDRDTRTRDPFVSTSLANEIVFVVNQSAGIHDTFSVPYGDDDLEDEAQMVEDYCDRERDEMIRGYFEATGGNLRRDEAMSERTYGMVCWRVLVNLDDPERPIRVDLLDPYTVFPTYDGQRGLLRVTRAYREPLARIVGLHDPDGSSGLRERIVQAVNLRDRDLYGLPDRGWVNNLQDHQLIEVVEYWDRKWLALQAGGVPVLGPVAHDYGKVPFVVAYTGSGAPQFTAMPSRERDARGNVYTAPRKPLEDIAVSAIHYTKHTHNALEAIHTRGILSLLKTTNPAVVLYEDPSAANTPMEPFDSGEGGVNRLQLGRQSVSMWPSSPTPNEYGPLLTQLSRDVATGMVPLVGYGINENSNVSGHALENLSDAGRHVMAPLIDTLERGRGALMELVVQFTRDWSPWMGWPENRGKLPVYRETPAPGESAFFEMTSEVIRKVGIRVKCSLRQVRLESLGPFFAAAEKGIALGGYTVEELLEARGVRDRVRYRRRWEHEALRRSMMEDPDYQKWAIGRMLANSDNPEDQEIAAWWMQRLQNQQSFSPGGGGGPGGPPPMGMPNPSIGPNTTAGISLPGLDMPPGPGGGPPGPVGPRPSYAPLG